MRRIQTRVRGPATLRDRLTLLALVTIAIWVTVLTVAFNLVLGWRLGQQADSLLSTRAAAVAATVDVAPDGQITVHEPKNDEALDVGIWIYQGAAAVERPSASTALQADADRLAGHGTTYVDVADPAPWRLYALPLTSGSHQVGAIIAAVGLDSYNGIARSALAASVGLAVLLLGGFYLMTRMVVGRALRPVGAMSAQAAQWSEHATARRFGADGRPTELAGLAANLDKLLDHLAAVLRHERQLTAELSHELRTPLARITAETDWLTTRPRNPADQLASHEAIAASAAAMHHICETLLSEARSRSDQVPGRCAVDEVARILAGRAILEHPEAPPVTVVGDTVIAGVSAALTERILTPLLDNARRYAKRRITVECARGPSSVQVAVADDGIGVPDDFGVAVFAPGRRADPADGHDGAGLGLALALRLARSADGDIVLADAPLGARFVISLPLG
jgi:signal transduction histidine kinase